MQRGTQTARFVGTTPDGQWIFEAPSGDAILEMQNDQRRGTRRRRHQHDEGRPQVLPAQPFEPDVRRALPPEEDQ